MCNFTKKYIMHFFMDGYLITVFYCSFIIALGLFFFRDSTCDT